MPLASPAEAPPKKTNEKDVSTPQGGTRPARSPGEECCICLEVLDGEGVSTLNPCRHRVHTDCIALWFRRRLRRPVCPLCRARIAEVQATVTKNGRKKKLTRRPRDIAIENWLSEPVSARRNLELSSDSDPEDALRRRRNRGARYLEAEALRMLRQHDIPQHSGQQYTLFGSRFSPNPQNEDVPPPSPSLPSPPANRRIPGQDLSEINIVDLANTIITRNNGRLRDEAGHHAQGGPGLSLAGMGTRTDSLERRIQLQRVLSAALADQYRLLRYTRMHGDDGTEGLMQLLSSDIQYYKDEIESALREHSYDPRPTIWRPPPPQRSPEIPLAQMLNSMRMQNEASPRLLPFVPITGYRPLRPVEVPIVPYGARNRAETWVVMFRDFVGEISRVEISRRSGPEISNNLSLDQQFEQLLRQIDDDYFRQSLTFFRALEARAPAHHTERIRNRIMHLEMAEYAAQNTSWLPEGMRFYADVPDEHQAGSGVQVLSPPSIIHVLGNHRDRFLTESRNDQELLREPGLRGTSPREWSDRSAMLNARVALFMSMHTRATQYRNTHWTSAASNPPVPAERPARARFDSTAYVQEYLSSLPNVPAPLSPYRAHPFNESVVIPGPSRAPELSIPPHPAYDFPPRPINPVLEHRDRQYGQTAPPPSPTSRAPSRRHDSIEPLVYRPSRVAEQAAEESRGHADADVSSNDSPSPPMPDPSESSLALAQSLSYHGRGGNQFQALQQPSELQHAHSGSDTSSTDVAPMPRPSEHLFELAERSYYARRATSQPANLVPSTSPAQHRDRGRPLFRVVSVSGLSAMSSAAMDLTVSVYDGERYAEVPRAIVEYLQWQINQPFLPTTAMFFRPAQPSSNPHAFRPTGIDRATLWKTLLYFLRYQDRLYAVDEADALTQRNWVNETVQQYLGFLMPDYTSAGYGTTIGRDLATRMASTVPERPVVRDRQARLRTPQDLRRLREETAQLSERLALAQLRMEVMRHDIEEAPSNSEGEEEWFEPESR